MSAIITLSNFSPANRDRHIGNSLYRICLNDKGFWYIIERYSDKNTWASRTAFYTKELKDVIDKLNSFTEEKEIIDMR